MIPDLRRLTACLAVLAALLLSSAAHAARARLSVVLVQASTEGAAIDPKLQGLAASFRAKHLNYTSFKLVQEQALEVAEGQTTTISSARGAVEVTLVSSADGKSQVRVKLANGGSTESGVDAQTQLILDAGASNGGELFVIVRGH